jgi:hypothetical protein
MHLTRITSETGGLSPLRTYSCGECGVWVTEAVEARSIGKADVAPCINPDAYTGM